MINVHQHWRQNFVPLSFHPAVFLFSAFSRSHVLREPTTRGKTKWRNNGSFVGPLSRNFSPRFCNYVKLMFFQPIYLAGSRPLHRNAPTCCKLQFSENSRKDAAITRPQPPPSVDVVPLDHGGSLVILDRDSGASSLSVWNFMEVVNPPVDYIDIRECSASLSTIFFSFFLLSFFFFFFSFVKCNWNCTLTTAPSASNVPWTLIAVASCRIVGLRN